MNQISDTVALGLVGVVTLIINLYFSISTNQKVKTCGTKECKNTIHKYTKEINT